MNNLSVRQKQIFQMLLNSSEFIPSKEIAMKLNVSVRTIKSDIGIIKSAIQQMNSSYQFQSSPSKGYKIQWNKVPTIKNNYLSDHYFYTANKYLEDDIRQVKIFLDLLNAKKILTVKYLVEKYYISRTTLYKDLNMIAEDLRKYQVQLVYKPYSGVYIEATEVSIRFALQNKLLLNMEVLEDNFEYYFHYCRFTKQNLLEFIQSFAIHKISEFELSHIYHHLLSLLLRCQINKYISLDTLTYETFVNELEIQKTYEYFYQYKSESLTIPRSEVIYFILLVKGCNLGFCNQFALDTTKQSLNELSLRLKIDLNDPERIADLSQYMYSLLIRNYNHFIQNSILIDDVKEKHSVSFDITYHYVKILEEMLNIHIQDNEISHLSYFFLNIREPLRKYYLPNKILVASFRGSTMSKYLLSELNSNFSFYVFESCELYELKEKVKQEQYSFIISDVAVHLDDNISIILISHFMDSSDFKLVRKHLRLLLRHLIDDYFDHISIIDVKNKSDFLHYISSSNEEYEILMEREKRLTYQMNHSVVVYLYNSVAKTMIYYVKNGIYWKSRIVYYILVINVCEYNKLLNYSKIIDIFLKRIEDM